MDVKSEMNNNNIQSVPKSKKVKEKPILIIEGEEDEIITEPTLNTIVNKGTGAGGSNTNYYGKKFEEKTNNEKRLMEMGYVKNSFTKKPKKSYDYYLSKTTKIGATWGDIPNESYKRPSFLLTDLERSIYPENEINVKNPITSKMFLFIVVNLNVV
jgi:hypothetical protein